MTRLFGLCELDSFAHNAEDDTRLGQADGLKVNGYIGVINDAVAHWSTRTSAPKRASISSWGMVMAMAGLKLARGPTAISLFLRTTFCKPNTR